MDGFSKYAPRTDLRNALTDEMCSEPIDGKEDLRK